MSLSPTVALLRHPSSPTAGVTEIAVQVARTAGGGLGLTYRLRGALGELALPAPLPPGPANGLWQHTCFEAFVASDGAAYREFNFSPSGQWAAYRFAGYRQREEGAAPGPAPRLAVRRFPDRLELTAELDAALLPASPLHLGLTAVIEAADGRLAYWALAHRAGQPDFHRRESFTLPLAALSESLP